MEPPIQDPVSPPLGDQTTRSLAGPAADSTLPYEPAARDEARRRPTAAQSRLGRFVLLKLLGAGSFGEVYQAHDPQLQRDVALKIARADKFAGDDDIEWFFREARAAAQFKHPHIVPVFEVGKEGTSAYIVSGLIEGETLAARLERQRLTPHQAVQAMAQLADAVHYAHQKGVFHRDIKPSNVMIDLQGAAHLMDFGLARRLEGEALRTQAGDVIGTPAYMSPEQARGEGHAVDARSDLYSLGVVLYELLTGQRPFTGSVYEIIRQVQDAEPQPPRRLAQDVSRDLEAICLKAMAKQPDDRYPSALHFAEDLRRWQNHEPVQARRIAPLTRAAKWVRRHPLVSTAIGTSLLIAASAAVYWQTRPAWLDVRISPAVAAAKVELDGQPLALDEQGRTVISRPPGRATLKGSASGFLPVEQEVVLVRGQENTALATIELVPTFGYAQVTSDPEGASVELVNAQGEVVARGTTPFNSPRLPSGRYTARIAKELYKPAEQPVELPTGDKVASAALVKLEPLLENAHSYELMRTIRKRLAQTTSLDVIERPLHEVVAMLSKQEKLAIVLDTQSLDRARVAANTPLSLSLRQVPLETLLRLLCGPLELSYLVETTRDGTWLIRIGTRETTASRIVTVVYPVRELVVNPNRPGVKDFDLLIGQILTTVSPSSWDNVGGPGSLRTDPSTNSLVVSQSWAAHLLIDDFLVNLREARLAAPVEPASRSEDQQARYAAIEKITSMGGTLKMNEFYPDYGVEGIDLKGSKVSEVDLECVALFPQLKRLALDSTSVRGDFVAKLSQPSQLATLSMWRTRVDDEAVAEIVKLPRISNLNLGRTRITDAALADVSTMTRLTVLHLDSTAVSDEGVSKLASLKMLRELNLTSTKVTDTSVDALGAMKQLRSIWLRGTGISDLGARQLAAMKSLTQVALSERVGDAGVAAIGSLPNLNYLQLEGTGVTNAGLASLESTPHLTFLNLRRTAITDAGLTHLSGLPLMYLHLNNTAVSDGAIPTLAKMQKLVVLDLRDTKITPEGLAKLRAALPRAQILSGSTAKK